jgi:replicative DNA helicase
MTRAAILPQGDVLDRLPPQNLEAEKALLGSIMLDPRVFDDVAAIVRRQDFYAHAHQLLFGHLVAMRREDIPIGDIALLVERLKQHGDFEAVGERVYLAEVAQSVPTAANATYYANIVRDKSQNRT